MSVLLSIMLASHVSFDHCPLNLQPHEPTIRALVDDAVERWTLKLAGYDPLLKDRCPIVVEMGKEKCIKLQTMVLAVGEDPVYCYGESGEIIRSYDDVE